jgi:signal transduction histidine kinase
MHVADPVNILLVDDQPAKLLTYEAMLDQLGANLIKASSGREALEHLLKQEITLVLMDVSMPDLDGFELAEIIREHPRFRKTAIIFVSAVHLTDMDRLKGYASGAVDYVAVPVQAELLRAKVSVFTELRRKTIEAERLARELERRVSERTAELEASTERLRELADELRAADRRKDEFLALLAHELRNPLAPVLNAVAIMRARSLADTDLVWCRDIIERQALQLTRLVDDLLDVSRISRGKVRLRFEPVELSTVLRGAVETSQPIVDAQRHELRISQPMQPVVVNGDAARLVQVVANLVNNAAKYQEPGGKIDVSVVAENGTARITVSDRGFGIDEALLPRVFEPFTQGNPALDRTQGGLGIGLYLVKNIVDLHGGSVVAVSEGPGRGTTLTVDLPLMQQQPVAESEVPATTRAVPAGSRRVLVVDDNPDGGDSLVALLKLSGYDASLAGDGPAALEMAAKNPPDVVLLDIGLPGMDGYEVCRLLRERGHENATIIALTGYGRHDRGRLDVHGFDNYIVKPCPLPELLRILESATLGPRTRGKPEDTV